MDALDREVAIHARHAHDLGAIDLAARTAPERLDQVIAPEALTRCGGGQGPEFTSVIAHPAGASGRAGNGVVGKTIASTLWWAK